MKPLANGRILQSDAVSAIECLHYALNLPTSVVITGIDSMPILDQAFKAVDTFSRLTATDLQQLLAKTASAASTGEFELFKTTSVSRRHRRKSGVARGGAEKISADHAVAEIFTSRPPFRIDSRPASTTSSL